MLTPGVRVIAVASAEIVGDALILLCLCDDGTLARTWWSVTDDLPRFMSAVAVIPTPRPAGVPLQ
jgi:hypothetical protein